MIQNLIQAHAGIHKSYENDYAIWAKIAKLSPTRDPPIMPA